MRTANLIGFCLFSALFSPLFAQNDWRESLFAFSQKLDPKRLFELPDGRLAIVGQTESRSRQTAFCVFADGATGLPIGDPAFFGADGSTAFEAVALLADGTLALAGRQNGGGGRPDVGFWVLAAPDGSELSRFSISGHRESAILAAATAGENRLALGGRANDGGSDRPFLALFDGKTERWRLAEIEQKALGGEVRDLLFDQKGQLVALGKSSKNRVWLARIDAATGRVLTKKTFDQKEKMGDPMRLLEAPDGSFWLAGREADAGGRDWNLWTARAGEGLDLLEARGRRDLRSGAIAAIALEPSGGVLAVGAGRSEVPLWRDREAFSVFFDQKGEPNGMDWRGGKFNDGWLDAALTGSGAFVLLGKKGAQAGPDSFWLARRELPATVAAAKSDGSFEIEKLDFRDAGGDGALGDGEKGWLDLTVKNSGPASLVALEVRVSFSDAATRDFLKIEYGERQSIALLSANRSQKKPLALSAKKGFDRAFSATVTVKSGSFSAKKTVDIRGSRVKNDEPSAAASSKKIAGVFFSDNSRRGVGKAENALEVEIDVHAEQPFGLPNLELIQLPKGNKSTAASTAQLEWLKSSAGHSARYKNTVFLAPGENKFLLRMLRDGAVVGEYEWTETFDLTQRKPNLHLVTMGIEYGEADAVKFTGADATDFAATFSKQEGEIFQKIFSKNLIDTRSTSSSSIKNTFSKLRAFDPQAPAEDAVFDNDLVMVFISGHGVVRDGTFYLLPSDHSEQTELVPFQEKIYGPLSKLPGKVVIVLDACFSGAAGKSGAFLAAEENEMRQIIDDMDSQSGAIMISSCRGSQVSWEHPTKRHGVFTLAWLEAVAQGCKVASRQTATGCGLSLGDIFEHVERRVPEICGEIKRDAQAPKVLTPKIDKDKIWLYWLPK